jgi:putative transposase
MVAIRNVPSPTINAFGQPERIRFEQDDRIVLDGPDDADWRPLQTNEDGHILQASHDKNIKRALTHEQMRIEATKPGFRHDRHWYSTKAMTARLRADVSEMKELPFEERQKITWKESFVLGFLELENADPENVTLGDEKMIETIARIDAKLRGHDSKVADKGRRKREGRQKIFYDPPGPKALRKWIKLYLDAGRDQLALRSRTLRAATATNI